MTKLPAWAQPMLFAVLSTGFASFLVSGISTLRARGAGSGFIESWMAGWLFSWPVAAVAIYIVAPHVRRLLAAICATE